MAWLEFSQEEIQELKQQWEQHPHPRVRKKMMVVYFKSQGLPHGQIAALAGVSPNTVRTYLEQYEQGGIPSLKEIPFYRPQSELMKYREQIEAHFEQHPPRTTAEAAEQIEQLTGIRRSKERVEEFLRKLELKYRSVRAVSPKACPEQQRRFL